MATFDEIITSLPTEPLPKGRAFENICKWFLENDPVYSNSLRKVWLWDDWPGRWGPDAGIDLVAETRDGNLWAIQAKAYDETTSVTKRDVDSFLSESNREQFKFRLLIATIDRIARNATQVVIGQEKQASLLLLSDLASRPLVWPEDFEHPSIPEPSPLIPRDDQEEALQAIESKIQISGRGRVIMASGSGKTLVGLWAHERLNSQRTLVVVPSLFLVQQMMEVWTANRSRPFDFLAVCSDETVVSSLDSSVSSVSGIGVPVTTNPADIREFLEGNGDRVIFSTYQSSPRVAEAMSDTELRFGLIIADEAHQLAGNTDREFATCLSDNTIPADRRIFFTATPRYFTGKSLKVAGENDLEVASMDNVELFGPEAHRLSFGEAIKRDLLSDYQVVVVGVTDREAYELAREGAFVEFKGEQTDARSLARQIGLAKAMLDYDLHRVISFHSRVKLARQFSASFRDVIENLPSDCSPQGTLISDYVSGTMPTGERRVKLNHLRNAGGNETTLITNARCLSEGVDVPSLDGVAFIDPRRSQIDIVQAVGRAIRKTGNKNLGTILIPVLVPDGADEETILDESVFKPVWDVVRALRNHDEELADQLDAARRKKGREGILTCDELPGKIILDLPGAIVGSKFIDAIITRIVEYASSSWEECFSHLEQFVKENNHARVPKIHKTADGFNLGAWVHTQRGSKDKLDSERIKRLDSLSFDWDPVATDWEKGFAYLEQFVKENNHARVPQRHKTADGFNLGSWVNNHRGTKGKLDSERIKRLDSLSFDWDPVATDWEKGFAYLEQFVKENNHARVPQRHKTADGFNLGSWVNNHRGTKGKLDSERIKRLDSLTGWKWRVNLKT